MECLYCIVLLQLERGPGLGVVQFSRVGCSRVNSNLLLTAFRLLYSQYLVRPINLIDLVFLCLCLKVINIIENVCHMASLFAVV